MTERSLAVFEDYRIRRVYDEELQTWYFSVVDIIRALIQLDYQAARNYWKVLKNRLNKEGSETVTKCNRLKLIAEDGKWFAGLSEEERQEFKAEYQRRHAIELLEYEPANPERRSQRVGELASDAPERLTEKRSRTISIGREEVKKETEEYLRQQYKKDDDPMTIFCQVCKKPMPFKLDNGYDHFEKVEFLSDLKKRHYQNYLALCPNHSAMFRFANGSREKLKDMFLEIDSKELEVVLARKKRTIYFTKTHIADLKAVIKAEQQENEQAGQS